MYNTNLIEAFEELETARIPLDEQQVKQIISQCINNLYSIGLKIHKFERVLPISISLYDSNSSDILGVCGLNKDATGAVIRLNKHLYYEGLEDLLINTIYHELCHYFQFCDTIVAGRGPKYKKHQDYFNSDNEHSPCWWKYADRINKRLKPTIKLTATVDNTIYDRFIKVNKEDILFTIYCPRCNKAICSILDFKSFSSKAGGLAPLIVKTVEAGGKVPCSECGGPVIIKYKDEATKQRVLKEVASYLQDMSEKGRLN